MASWWPQRVEHPEGLETARKGGNPPVRRSSLGRPSLIVAHRLADHAEVNPATRTLDVRSGFQSSIKVPKLPFRHVLALALVIQVASDDYGRVFTLGIEVDRVDELPVMLHQDFSFEIPRGIYAADGVSHHYPFTFSLPVDFYDVGLHSVIVGDEDSDVAHVPFIVQMVTLDEH